jgi:hypothetical protein
MTKRDVNQQVGRANDRRHADDAHGSELSVESFDAPIRAVIASPRRNVAKTQRWLTAVTQ